MTIGKILCIPLTFMAFMLEAAPFRFTEAPAYKIQTSPWTLMLAFGDLNGDGALDMTANAFGTNWDGKACEILIFFNKDKQYPMTPDRRIPLPHAQQMAIHDFNLDGKNDIGLVAGKHLVMLLNKDDFNPEEKNRFFNTNQSVAPMQVCKINGQGSYDVLVGPVWRKFFVTGDKIRKDDGYILGPDINDIAATLTVDLDDDDVMDIIGKGRHDNTLRIYYGPLLTLNVNPHELSDFLQMQIAGTLSVFTVADLNADGLNDLIVGDAKNRKTYIYFQNEPVGFDADAQPSVTLDGGGSARTADLDGDGLADLIVLDHYTSVAVFLQKPGQGLPGGMDQADQLIKIPKSGQIFLEDIDGDGVPDLIVKCSNGIVQVHPGNIFKP